MREIKFRAWDKKENKMQQVVQILYGHEASNYPLSVDFFRSVKSRLIKDIELMQYTGLKDKNGVEIYEGDILKEDGILSTVEYKDDIPGFGLNNSKYSLCMYSSENMEIIGNIFENKELLK